MPVAAASGRLPVLAEPGGEQAMDDTGCPEPGCDLLAEILDRTILESTDGPVGHARIGCVGGHRFLMPTAMLPGRPNLHGARSFAVAGAMRGAATPSEQWSR
jgi:hypothetical protein